MVGWGVGGGGLTASAEADSLPASLGKLKASRWGKSLEAASGAAPFALPALLGEQKKSQPSWETSAQIPTNFYHSPPCFFSQKINVLVDIRFVKLNRSWTVFRAASPVQGAGQSERAREYLMET